MIHPVYQNLYHKWLKKRKKKNVRNVDWELRQTNELYRLCKENSMTKLFRYYRINSELPIKRHAARAGESGKFHWQRVVCWSTLCKRVQIRDSWPMVNFIIVVRVNDPSASFDFQPAIDFLAARNLITRRYA